MMDALQLAAFWLYCSYAAKQKKQQTHDAFGLYCMASTSGIYLQTLISQLQTIWQLHAAVWLWQSDLNSRQAACLRWHGLHRQLAPQGFKMKRILLIALSYTSMLIHQQNQLLVLKAMAGMILTYMGAVTDLHLQTLSLRTSYLVQEQQR